MAGAAAKVDMDKAQGDYPFANTRARAMLEEALNRAEQEKGWSQRQVAGLLKYKATVVVSHMAIGRTPIPIDRAMDFARLLNIPPAEFTIAILEQRHPEIPWESILKPKSAGEGRKTGKEVAPQSYLADELASLAGKPLDNLPQDIVNTLREVVADRNAPRRWMNLGEVSIIEKIRESHPHGLSIEKRRELEDFIAQM